MLAEQKNNSHGFFSRVNGARKRARLPRAAPNMVKSYAQTICLKDDPDGIEEYKRYHRDAWPEVLEALAAVGVLHMKIYLLSTRMFMYMETVDEFDPAVDFPRHMELSPKCVEWGERMREFQVPAPEANRGDWWAYMEEVFDLASQLETKDARRGHRND